MLYEDLLFTPYVEFGRDSKKGLDCYGLILELAKRNNIFLTDFLNYDSTINIEILETEVNPKLNFYKIDYEDIKQNDIFEIYQNGVLHMGYVLNDDTLIHMTYTGVKINHKSLYKKAKFYRIKK